VTVQKSCAKSALTFAKHVLTNAANTTQITAAPAPKRVKPVPIFAGACKLLLNGTVYVQIRAVK
jgi:hypothetical protein